MNQLDLKGKINPLEDKFGLTPCLDCNREISKYCESCPQCGRFYGRIKGNISKVEVIGYNWIIRIALGVIVGYLVISIINAILFFLFFSSIMAAMAAFSRR